MNNWGVFPWNSLLWKSVSVTERVTENGFTCGSCFYSVLDWKPVALVVHPVYIV